MTALTVVLAFFVVIFALKKIQPVREILYRAEKLLKHVPYKERLSLYYHKDEWKLVEKVLEVAEKTISSQKQDLNIKNLQSSALLDIIPNELMIIDEILGIQNYNKKFKKTFFKNVEPKFENLKVWKVFEQHPFFLDQCRFAVENDQESSINAVYFEDLNKYFNISFTPLILENGKLQGVLVFFYSVTQEKLNEKARVDFVANVSHEVRTPLTSILGYSQLLESLAENLAPENKVVISKIENNVKRLKDLFSDLLELSSIESTRKIKRELIPLEPFLERIIATVKGKYLAREITFKTQLVGELTGDVELLEQVFTNLIDNSIKYNDKDKVQIAMESSEVDHQLVIHLKDNGPGISPEYSKRVFERFYRIQGVSEEVIEGSGLGLSIVKHIVGKHSGKIELHENRPCGCHFISKIPLKMT